VSEAGAGAGELFFPKPPKGLTVCLGLGFCGDTKKTAGSAVLDAIGIDMSIPCPLLSPDCIPLRIRTPSIAANESNATPMAGSPIGILLALVTIFPGTDIA
jgi:hypothetical protein